MFEVTVEASFSAAHRLRGYAGKCANNHGHNFRVRVTVQGNQLDDVGMLVDFGLLKGWLREICERYDHASLNDIAPFDAMNPTTEILARTIADELAARLRGHTTDRQVEIASVWIQETDTNFAAYRPK